MDLVTLLPEAEEALLPVHVVERTTVLPVADSQDSTPKERLRIVDYNGTPLPGVDYYQGLQPDSSRSGLLEVERWQMAWEPTDEWLRNHCVHAVSDALGYVWSDTTDYQALYLAKSAEQVTFGPFPRRAEMRFPPPRQCRIQLIQEDGTPVVGAAVVLRDDERPGTSKSPILGFTDATGQCTVQNIGRLMNLNGAGEGGHTHWLGIRGLGFRGSDVEVDARHVPSSIRIVVPSCAPLALELVDPSGRRHSSERALLLVSHPEKEELKEFTRATGPVFFGHCVVSLDLRLEDYEGLQLPTPRVSGKLHVVRVALQDLCPSGAVLTGHVRRSDGSVLANARLLLCKEGGGRLGTGHFGRARPLRIRSYRSS